MATVVAMLHRRLVARGRATIGRLNSSTTSAKPFKVLGLQQVAVGGTDKGKLANLWTNLLGLPRVGTYRAEKENVDEDVLQLGGLNVRNVPHGARLMAML